MGALLKDYLEPASLAFAMPPMLRRVSLELIHPVEEGVSTPLRRNPTFMIGQGVPEVRSVGFSPVTNGRLIYRELSAAYADEALKLVHQSHASGVILTRTDDEYVYALEQHRSFGIFERTADIERLVSVVFSKIKNVDVKQLSGDTYSEPVLFFFGASVERGRSVLLQPLTRAVMGHQIASIVEASKNGPPDAEVATLCAAGVFEHVYQTDYVAQAYSSAGLSLMKRKFDGASPKDCSAEVKSGIFRLLDQEVESSTIQRPYHCMLSTYENAQENCDFFVTIHEKGVILPGGAMLTGHDENRERLALETASRVASGETVVKPLQLG